jgi:IclR helix-turn-helix domain
VKISPGEKKPPQFEAQLLDEVQACIRELPGVEVLSAQRDAVEDGTRLDLDLRLRVQDRLARVVVETRKRAYPRDLLAAARQLQRLRCDDGDLPVVPLIAAPSVSPGGRALLRQEGLGYWDAGGSFYLELPWALYFIDRPPPRLAGPQQLDLFRGNAAQVLHALLLEPGREWHLQDLAELAEVALSRVHRTLSVLEEHLWVEKRGKGPRAVRILRDPGALLDAWATDWKLTRYQFQGYHRWARTPAALRRAVTEALDALAVEYGLTLTSGAELVAPFATGSERLTLLLPATADLAAVAGAAGLKAVEEGENVTFLLTRERSPLLFRRRLEEAWVASDVQLYLDLFAWPARGKEQARHLRAERLPY